MCRSFLQLTTMIGNYMYIAQRSGNFRHCLLERMGNTRPFSFAIILSVPYSSPRSTFPQVRQQRPQVRSLRSPHPQERFTSLDNSKYYQVTVVASRAGLLMTLTSRCSLDLVGLHPSRLVRFS